MTHMVSDKYQSACMLGASMMHLRGRRQWILHLLLLRVTAARRRYAPSNAIYSSLRSCLLVQSSFYGEGTQGACYTRPCNREHLVSPHVLIFAFQPLLCATYCSVVSPPLVDAAEKHTDTVLYLVQAGRGGPHSYKVR